jgi:hypothetical protein
MVPYLFRSKLLLEEEEEEEEEASFTNRDGLPILLQAWALQLGQELLVFS